jgi:hypothetical protein
MVDWTSPETIAANYLAFDRFMHCLLGVYVWEWVLSLDFDWQYISGRKQFRWPLVFYFLNRYCLLFALIGITIALNVQSKIDCQVLYTFNSVFGQASIGLASINLSLRTIAIWSKRWFIVGPLVLIILGHWTLLLFGIHVKAQWVDGHGCVITGTASKLLSITFIYTMVFDFIVLGLTAFKLLFPATTRSPLVNLVFNDGLAYFFIAFLANAVATVFGLLNLNPVMSIIANVPAVIAASIAACRAVRRLSDYSSKGQQVFAASVQGSTIAFRSMSTRPKASAKVGDVVTSQGVHVKMDTLTHVNDATNNLKDDTYDPNISDEFKRPPY